MKNENGEQLKTLIEELSEFTGRTQAEVWSIFEECADEHNTVDLEVFELRLGLPKGLITGPVRMTRISEAVESGEPIDAEAFLLKLLDGASPQKLHGFLAVAVGMQKENPGSVLMQEIRQMVEAQIAAAAGRANEESPFDAPTSKGPEEISC